MTSLSVPEQPRARSASITSEHMVAMGLPSGSNPNPSLVQGNIGHLGTMIDLLNASAHDPELNYDSDESSDEADEPPTPTSAEDHDGPHTFRPSEDQLSRPLPRRGQSSYQGQSSTPQADQLAIQLNLETMQSVDDAIARAQTEEEGEEETFEDPDYHGTISERTSAEMLATLVEEYGPWTDDSEEFIMQVPGALYRGVLIKGLLALTNRRFFIYAFIPPAESADKVLKAGPVTVHPPGRFTKKRRAWVELRADTLTWYANSSKAQKHKPMGSIRLSQMKSIEPHDDPSRTCSLVMHGITHSVVFDLDTEESAHEWKGEMDAALFMFRTTADKLRLSLPLQYVTRTLVTPFQTLAVQVHLEFDTVTPCSKQAAEIADDGKNTNAQSVDFGFLKTHSAFSDALLGVIDSAKELPPCGGSLPILEIESHGREEEDERLKVLADDNSLAAQFCRKFSLVDDPKDLFIASGLSLVRSVPLPGSIAISSSFFCFWRKNITTSDTLLRIPLVDIDDAIPVKAFGFRIWGMAVQIHGAHDCRIDFKSHKARDEVIQRIKEAALAASAAEIALTDTTRTESPALTTQNSFSSTISTPSVASGAPTLSIDTAATPPSSASSMKSPSTQSSITSPGPYTMATHKPAYGVLPEQAVVFGTNLEETVEVPAGLPILNRPKVLGMAARRKITGLHFVCLTIGSRGDVQPYISLGRELLRDGNKVTIASHPEYRDWVEGYGMSYKEVGGDPAALMKLTVEHKMFSPGFFKESIGHFRKWLDDLFHESWLACQDADILIESPSTMSGIHIAEALGIPYFRAFTMPWTATSAYPQAFASGPDLGPAYNLLSYSLYNSVIWKATAGQVNRWRKNDLGLKPTSEKKMSEAKVPFVYNFSSAVVPRPNDWKDHIYISGYWFLDDNKPWDPPAGLLEFIDKARADGKAVIYIGFGSIVVPDAAAMTKAVANAVVNADVRAILSKGWSERGDTSKREEVPLPDSIFSVSSIAHDHLFPLIDAACHHGGAGTTGASLRAGLPTLIHPFFGDQFFWSQRSRKLGVGIQIASLSEKELTSAFIKGTTDRIMKEKAEDIGKKIRAENGPRAALDFLYDHIHLAQVRTTTRSERAAGKSTPSRRTTRDLLPTSLLRSASGSREREKPERAATLPTMTAPHPLTERSATGWSLE